MFETLGNAKIEHPMEADEGDNGDEEALAGGGTQVENAPQGETTAGESEEEIMETPFSGNVETGIRTRVLNVYRCYRWTRCTDGSARISQNLLP